MINGAHPYWRRFAFDQLAALVEGDDTLATNPEVDAIMRQSLGYLDLETDDANSRDERLRNTLAKHFAPAWTRRPAGHAARS